MLKYLELLDHSYIYYYYHVESNQEPWFYNYLDKIEEHINILSIVVINRDVKVKNSDTIRVIDEYNEIKTKYLKTISKGIPIVIPQDDDIDDEYHREYIIPEYTLNQNTDTRQLGRYETAWPQRPRFFPDEHRGRSTTEIDEYHIHDNAPLADGDLYPIELIRRFNV